MTSPEEQSGIGNKEFEHVVVRVYRGESPVSDR